MTKRYIYLILLTLNSFEHAMENFSFSLSPDYFLAQIVAKTLKTDKNIISSHFLIIN